MKLYFYGASEEVTGSNYILETKKAMVALDCGAFQGGKDQELKNAADFLYDPKKIDAVVVSHAHLDHIGRIPKLVQRGFKGKIWATPPTRDLAEIILLDTASIMSHDELKFGSRPIYDQEDVLQTMSQFEGLDYLQKKEIAPGIEVRLVDAGHILGSACIEIWAEGKKLLFSGDLGNKGAPLIKDPTIITQADYVICEATYGGRTHESQPERLKVLREVINESIDKRGVLLIPAFSLERTQELLYDFDKLLEQRLVKQVPIFLDSPLAIKATRIFTKYPQYFDQAAIGLIKLGDQILQVPGIKFTETVEESKKINTTPPPKIVIAGSGMITGGRMMYHLKEYIEKVNTTLLFVGYQAKGTLGRRLRDGVKKIDLFHREYQVKAKMVSCGAFSAHADQPQLLKWLRAIKTPPKKIFYVHGEEKGLIALSSAVLEKLGVETVIPRFGQWVEI